MQSRAGGVVSRARPAHGSPLSQDSPEGARVGATAGASRPFGSVQGRLGTPKIVAGQAGVPSEFVVSQVPKQGPFGFAQGRLWGTRLLGGAKKADSSLTTPKLKTALGAPCTQNDSRFRGLIST